MNLLTIIPARLGSKGWPDKNRLLWEYADLGRVESTVVTTNDPTIAGLAMDAGARVIVRPESLATDEARLEDVVAHVCRQMPKHDGVWLQQLTQPCRRSETIRAAFEQFRRQGRKGTVVTVQPVPAHFRPQRMVEVGPDGALSLHEDAVPRRQDASPAYIRDGQAYIMSWRRALERDWYGSLCTAVVEAQPVPLPIDTSDDYVVARAWLEERALIRAS